MLSIAKKSFASTLSTEFFLIFITGLRALYNPFGDYQWRKQKIIMCGVFIQLHMVVICIWCALFVCRHNLALSSFFQTNVFANLVDMIGIFFYTHSPYFVCHCTEFKLSALQAGILE